MYKITIHAGDVTIPAELNDSVTALAIWSALPVEAAANTWGEEIYFSIPVILDLDPEARADVEVGELGYWPPGHAFCIFFGRTPASRGPQPRAASPVNVIGRLLADPALLRQVPEGSRVVVEKG